MTSVDNLGEGTFTDASYLTFDLAETRRFDFNHTQKNGGFGPSPTTALFTGVLWTDTNAAGVGYGWVTSPNSADIGVPNEYDQGGSNLYGKLFTDLYRDYASGHTSLGSRTFQIQVETGTQYSVRVYSGAQDKDQAVTVTVEGVALPQSLSTLAKEFGTLDFADAHDTNNDGLLNITFASAGGISPFWVANGVDIAKEPTALPLEAPIVTVEQGLRPGVDPITEDDLGPFVSLALNSWIDQGLTPEQIGILNSAQFIIQQLDNESGLLGYVDGLGRIVLDDDAAGWGWDTLLDSTEGNRIDLESVIAHEMGHLLGFADLDPRVFGNELMSAILGLGERHNALNGTPFFTSGGSEEDGPPPT